MGKANSSYQVVNVTTVKYMESRILQFSKKYENASDPARK